MVFCDVGLVDRRCFSSSGPIWCFFGDWVSDSMGFYMDFISKEEMRDAGGRERNKEKEKILF